MNLMPENIQMPYVMSPPEIDLQGRVILALIKLLVEIPCTCN
jgi:hypothetical protein